MKSLATFCVIFFLPSNRILLGIQKYLISYNLRNFTTFYSFLYPKISSILLIAANEVSGPCTGFIIIEIFISIIFFSFLFNFAMSEHYVNRMYRERVQEHYISTYQCVQRALFFVTKNKTN